MTRNGQVAIFFPLVTGSFAVVSTVLIHCFALGASVNLFRHERKVRRIGSALSIDLGIFVLTISFAFVAHLVEIGIWALLFIVCGEFKSAEIAYYHSAVNYSTLGYGDLIMTPSWKLLGPLEAVDGALMFGVSTAMIFAVAQRLMRARFGDLQG